MKTAGRPRWWAWGSVGVGVVLVAGAVIGLSHHRPAPTDAGQLPAVIVTVNTTVPGTTRSAAPRPAPAAPTTTSGRAQVSSPTQKPTTHSSPTAAPSPVTAQPAVLTLPTLGVTADVGPVESVQGVLQVPDDVNRVGWWTGSAPAGTATGSTVIDGHIDSAVQGEGAFFHLADLGPGDPVTVRTTTGRTIRYTVAARRVYVKAQGLPSEVFTDPGYPRLVLISCGGSFDYSERSYNDNIVVYATPDA